MRGKNTVLLILAILMMACPLSSPFPPTGIEPEIGYYTGAEGVNFRVYEDNGKKYLYFSSDNYRYDSILVNNGAFHRQWGQGTGGVHCPTDAYILSGHFTSSTIAEGRIRYGQNCQYGEWYEFVVEKVS